MINTEKGYNWVVMIIVTILMMIGFAILYFTLSESEIAYVNFGDFIHIYQRQLEFSIFFIGVGLCCWQKFLSNEIIKPRENILYLENIKSNVCLFLDSKGKEYMYFAIDTKMLKIGNYYAVMKTKDVVKEILDVSNITFTIPKKKISFWFNLYSPLGNFKNLLLLPILYVIFLIELLNVIMADTLDKIQHIIFLMFPLIFIIYDFLYKIEKSRIIKENKQNAIKKKSISIDVSIKNMIESYFLEPISRILGGLFATGLCGLMFLKIADITRFFIIPFLICGIVILIEGIIELFNTIEKTKPSHKNRNSNKQANKIITFFSKLSICSKIVVITFLLFLSGFLIMVSYISIKAKEYTLLVYTIPFWIVAIFLGYNNFKK